jgi:predicted nucleic acid-binding protein
VGLALYKARPDKGYSLTDCISMHAMRERGVSEIMKHDDHFRQEGFTVLL